MHFAIIQNAKLDESQVEIKIARRNISYLRYADDTTLTAESKDQPRSPTLQVNSLPTEVQGKNFMANRWENSGNSVRLYFGRAPKPLQIVTATMKLKDACSLEEKL